ncbi:MAG: fructosamine kinase [Candidatus Hydrogenedentota bacterium]
MRGGVEGRLETVLGAAVAGLRALSGGCIGDVYRADLTDGRRVVIKVDSSSRPQLDVEAYMLRYLREHSGLPVPDVLHGEPGLLVLAYIEGDSRFGPHEQTHAAELLAELHSVKSDRFGLERDTLIGSLHQPNPWTATWIDFFREHRLIHMARGAYQSGRMPKNTYSRVEAFAARLEQYLLEPESPSLLHGDVWTTNVLAHGGRITGFIDPAIYFGHPEIELAFTTLFGTFGDVFFGRYHELRPIEPGFFEVRRDVYNLYPLLVHVRLFGGGYLGDVERTLARLGF